MFTKYTCSFLFSFILSICSFSQNNFEKGYLIDNNGNKTECLIKNLGWLNNPTEFEYKINANSEIQRGNLNNTKEFSIYNSSYQFKKYTVKIDLSSNYLRDLSNIRTPDFKEKKVFLKILFQVNETALYEFLSNGVSRYFYEAPTINIEQLVYKRYLTNDDKILENNRFRQQLWTGLKCKNITSKNIKNIKYSKKDLINYFKKYSDCKGFSSEEKIIKDSKEIINLSIRPRINSSSFSMNKAGTLLTYARDVDYGNKMNFGLGLELEYILPFNNNKWGAFIEPTYSSFKGEKILVYNSGFSETNFIADIKLIEIPLGVRHYFFLNNNAKLFLNTSYVFSFNLNSLIYDENDRFSDEFEVSPEPNLSFGLGYNYKNTYTLEIRLGLKKEVLNSFSGWYSNLNTVSFIIGYNLFNKKQ